MRSRIKQRLTRAVSAGLVATQAVLLLQTALAPTLLPQALACGPFLDEAVFECSMHPDLPFRLYAAGQINLIEPSWARSYQVVAYRSLIGKPLSQEEQKAMLDLWNFRLGSGNNGLYDGAPAQKWQKDRLQILGKKATPFEPDNVFGTVGEYTNYLNCSSDAFKTASATLARIVAKYGADSPVCREWLKGQDAVFCHCSSPPYDYQAKKPGTPGPFPQPLPASEAVELRQDRTYQMAAAYFYAAKLDDALKLFTAIAADKTSPWQTISEYMVARTLIRKGTLSSEKTMDKAALTKAMAMLKELAANPSLKTYAESINSLINYVDIRLEPATASVKLAAIIAGGTAGDKFRDDVDAYLFCLDRLFGYSADDDNTAKPLKVADAPAVPIMRANEMTDWIWCFTSPSKDAAEVAHAAAKFKATHSTLWAVAYASKLKGNESTAGEVKDVLAKVSKSDPAYVSACYYRAKLQFGANQIKEGQATIDAGLAAANLSPSASNSFEILRLQKNNSLDTFIDLSFRPPALISPGYNTVELPEDTDKAQAAKTFAKLSPLLMQPSADAYNTQLPLSVFLKTSLSASLPAAYKGPVAQATFCRAIILGDFATAQKVVPALKAAYPRASAKLSTFEAASPADKLFAATDFMLANPGSKPFLTGGTGRTTDFDKIDDFGDNWWSPEPVDANEGADESERAKPAPKFSTSFLSAADKSLGKAQTAQVSASGLGANYLGKIAIDYARAHPSDPRVPQVLATVVKATHFGSSDQSVTTKVSTAAFQLLHSKYPGNPWTKKTPYHY